MRKILIGCDVEGCDNTIGLANTVDIDAFLECLIGEGWGYGKMGDDTSRPGFVCPEHLTEAHSKAEKSEVKKDHTHVITREYIVDGDPNCPVCNGGPVLEKPSPANGNRWILCGCTNKGARDDG